MVLCHDLHSAMQRGVLDFMALSLGLARSLRPASHRLTIQRPHQWLCMPRNFVIFTILVLVSAGMYAVFMWYLSIQPWFTGGNGSSHQVLYVVCMTSPAVGVILCCMQPVCACTELHVLLLLPLLPTFGKSLCVWCVCMCPSVCCRCICCGQWWSRCGSCGCLSSD